MIAWTSASAVSYPLRSPTTERSLWRMPLAFRLASQYLELFHSKPFLIHSLQLDPDKSAAICTWDPCWKGQQAENREATTDCKNTEVQYSYYTKSFKSKNNNLVHKPVFEKNACCLQRGRDMTTITDIVSVSIRSLLHIMCETRYVPRSSDLTNTHRRLWTTQWYRGTLSRDGARRRRNFQGIWTDIYWIVEVRLLRPPRVP